MDILAPHWGPPASPPPGPGPACPSGARERLISGGAGAAGALGWRWVSCTCVPSRGRPQSRSPSGEQGSPPARAPVFPVLPQPRLCRQSPRSLRPWGWGWCVCRALRLPSATGPALCVGVSGSVRPPVTEARRVNRFLSDTRVALQAGFGPLCTGLLLGEHSTGVLTSTSACCSSQRRAPCETGGDEQLWRWAAAGVGASSLRPVRTAVTWSEWRRGRRLTVGTAGRTLCPLQITRNTTPTYRTPEAVDLYSHFPIGEKQDIWVRPPRPAHRCLWRTEWKRGVRAGRSAWVLPGRGAGTGLLPAGLTLSAPDAATCPLAQSPAGRLGRPQSRGLRGHALGIPGGPGALRWAGDGQSEVWRRRGGRHAQQRSLPPRPPPLSSGALRPP